MRLIALILLVVASYGVNAQCSAPTDLSTSPITATAANARWAPVSGAVSYDVEYKPASSSTWTPYILGITGLQCLMSYGLEPLTTYDWRVRANCASGSSSYSQTQFTTGPIGSCVPPVGLSASNITSTSVIVSWSPAVGAFGYSVQFKPSFSSVWSTVQSLTYATSTNITFLSAGTTYDWRVWSNCSLIETSTPNVAQFTTSTSGSNPPASVCPSPLDLQSNGTTTGAATIPLNTDVKGMVSQKNDIDHYKFTISTRGTITAYLTTLPANYDLAVLNSSGGQIASSQNKSTKNEVFSLILDPGTYYAKVFPVGTANNARSCYTLKMQTGTAARSMAVVTEENVKPDFSFNFYPNPAGDQLNVMMDGVDSKADIKVYNLAGKLVMQRQSNTMLTQLNISKFPAGIYLLNVNNGKETKVAKFVKQ